LFISRQRSKLAQGATLLTYSAGQQFKYGLNGVCVFPSPSRKLHG